MNPKHNTSSPLPATEKEYRAIVRAALQHFHDPRWLGENSPLATPYLLGHWLQQEADIHQQDVVARGNILRRLIQAAGNTIAQGDSDRPLPWARILELRYLAEEQMKVHEIVEALHTSESAEGRQHPKALDALVVEILKLLKPALRLESPVRTAGVVGRQLEVELSVASLNAGKTITIHGPSGIGKTTFGVLLANQVAPNAFFWFTIRPGLNDHINSVIFALAYFLHQQGITGTWLQIMTDQGRVEEHTTSLLRHDLQRASNHQLLLCFDEVDLLRPAEVQAHTRLVPFIDSLRQMAPLLLIGQKPMLDADHIVTLEGLDFVALQQMLSTAGIALAHEQLLDLHRQTQGNPRLIELYIAHVQAMRRQGLALDAAFVGLSDRPSVELLLQRIWRHLNEAEMHLIELFALFQSAIPRSAWSDENEQEAFATLLEWRLLQADGQGSILMLPILQETVVHLLDADEATALHLEAAEICTRHRQFTAASHHYHMAGMAGLAVHLLQDHLDSELDQGQAFAAERILKAIASHQLELGKERELLQLLRAKVHQTLGEHGLALDDIQKSLWKVPFLKVQAASTGGGYLNVTRRADQSVASLSNRI